MNISILHLCLGALTLGIAGNHAVNAAALPSVAALSSATPGDLVQTPAGARGFVGVNPDTKRLVFDDGTPATFYAVNFASFLNEPNRVIPTEEIVELLSGMKAVGINAIRCQVSDDRIQKGVFGKGINPVALENRDRFIAEGKKLGIYFHMCLSLAGSGRGGATELFKKAGGNREMMILVDEFIDYQRTFTTNLLNHVNPYTGIAYKDEPAILSWQLGNEQHAYSRPGWQMWTKHSGPYAEEIKSKWNRFLAEKYTNRDSLSKAWGKTLQTDEDPSKGTVTITDARYPTWKDNFTPQDRQQDIILFADAMQRRFHDIMHKTIREEIGDTKHLISDNGWIRGDRLIRQTAHEKLDLLDLQHYWPHGERGRMTADKLMNISAIKDCGVNILASMLTAREFDGRKKPGFITEYNSHKDNVRLPQFVPIHTVFSMLTGMDGVALWAYGSHNADNFFNQDHWFGFNRDTSDLDRELIPFVVGSYLWRTSIPELINSESLSTLVKWDQSNQEGLSVDYDASLQQATSVGALNLPKEGVWINFPRDSMLIDRADVVFFTGTGPFKSGQLTYQPVADDQPYLLAVFPVDGKPLAESQNWRVFSSLDGTLRLKRGDFKSWKAKTRQYATSRGSNGTGQIANATWELRRPLDSLYFDLSTR